MTDTFLKLLLVLAAFNSTPGQSFCQQSDNRPNIIYIMTDDLGLC